MKRIQSTEKNNSDLGNSGWQEIWKISIKLTLWGAPSYSNFLSIKNSSSSFKHRFVKTITRGQCSYVAETTCYLIPIHLSRPGSSASFPGLSREKKALSSTYSGLYPYPTASPSYSALQRSTWGHAASSSLHCNITKVKVFACFTCVFHNI